MIRLHPEQLNGKLQFMHDYISAQNAADGSKMDANASVTQKNIATMEAEIMKDFSCRLTAPKCRAKLPKFSTNPSPTNTSVRLRRTRFMCTTETSLKPYCVSVTLYPFLLDGLSKLGGESKAPQHLASFCGSFINLVFAISAQFAGAVATVEFLTYFDYFARKDYGDDYLETTAKKSPTTCSRWCTASTSPLPRVAIRAYSGIFPFTINTISTQCSAISSPRFQKTGVGERGEAAKLLPQMVQSGTHQSRFDFPRRDRCDAD